MSRNYAQIFTAIWRDPDFIALTRRQQQAYLLLVTQPNISAAGMLPLTERRWAKMAADDSVTDLCADIAHLHQAGMVAVDEDTQELLVRSFVRHDNGYRNPRRQPSIRDAAREVQSAGLRRVLAAELVRLDCPEWMPEMVSASTGSAETDSSGDAPLPVPFSQVNSHSDSQNGIEGMPIPSATARTTTHNPQPATRNPVPSSTARPADAGRQEQLFSRKHAADASSEPTIEQRAFGIARKWIGYRAEQGTPVVATGKGKEPELHKLKNLIEPFLSKGYTDDDVKLGLVATDEGIPSAASLDRALTRLRNQQKGRMSGGLRPAAPESNAPRRIPAAEVCPKHRGQKAGKCGLCRAEAHGAREEVTGDV